MYDQDVKDLEARLAAIREELAPLEARRTELCAQLRKAREMRDKAIDPATLTIKDHLTYNHQETRIAYKRAQEFFRELGLSTGGYLPATMQRQLVVCAYKNKPGEVERLVTAIQTVAPHLIYHEGLITFGILEHTLSEDGVYELDSKENGGWEVVKTTYSTTRTVKSWPNLKQAVGYIVDRLYYEDVDGPEDD
jgi:hypothetical protein